MATCATATILPEQKSSPITGPFGIDQPPASHVGDPLFPQDIDPFGRGIFIRPRREDGRLEEVAG